MTGIFALCVALVGAVLPMIPEARADSPKPAATATASATAKASAATPTADADAEKSWSGDDDDAFSGDDDPSRLWLTLGAGTSLRLSQNRDFAQDTFAPSYIDVFGAWVMPGHGFWRHGFGLGVSSNLTSDGGVIIGVDAFEELVLSPTYLARLAFSDSLLATLKVGIPWALSPNNNLGAGVDMGGVWRVFAAFGVYAEVGVSLFIGGDGAVSPLASGELGVVIDYEVLP